MNAIIRQTMHKEVLIDEDVLLKQLGINPSEYRIASVSTGHGSNFVHGGTAVLINLVEIPECQRKGRSL